MPRPTGIPKTCKHCGAIFLIWPSDLKYIKGKFCSNQCSTEARFVPIEQRIWLNVRKTEGCWLWTGGTTASFGYGEIRINGYLRRVHRIVWEMTYGPIPKGLHILHKCDTPPCVRPDHLFLGTQLDNIRDMDIKGRRVNAPCFGEDNHFAKLSEQDIVKIRLLKGKMTGTEVAKIHGVTHALIYDIWNRKIWKHLP